MHELLSALLQAVITVAAPIIAGFAVRWFVANTEHAKANIQNDTAIRYIDEVRDAVSTAVLCTAQTYADELKKSGIFDKENQRNAFSMAYSQAKEMLTNDAIRFIEMAYGDVTKYLTALIEAQVKLLK